MVNLAGRTAVITGATGIVGPVACERFCASGARVVGVDVDGVCGRALERRLVGLGHDFAFRALDVAERDDAEALAVLVRERFGRLDALYNSVGCSPRGAFRATQLLGRLMGPGGSIVTVVPTGGQVGSFIEEATMDLSPAIRVHAISPRGIGGLADMAVLLASHEGASMTGRSLAVADDWTTTADLAHAGVTDR